MSDLYSSDMATPAPLNEAECEALPGKLPNWTVEDDRIRRTWEFADFAEAWGFMEQVSIIAENLQHHPDWSNSWNRVDVIVTTHSAGRLTHLDVAFAEAVDALG